MHISSSEQDIEMIGQEDNVQEWPSEPVHCEFYWNICSVIKVILNAIIKTEWLWLTVMEI